MTNESNNIDTILDRAIENFARSIPAETIESNVQFELHAGMRPRIIRSSDGKCCAWCSSVAGEYYADEAPDDIYKRHDNCNCTVTYISEKGYQDAHTKKWIDQQKTSARRARIDGDQKYINDLILKRKREAAERKAANETGGESRSKKKQTAAYDAKERRIAAEKNMAENQKRAANVRTLRNTADSDIIKPTRTIRGHNTTPQKDKPGTITDHLNADDIVDTRTFYGEDGYIKKQINTTDHGNPKNHPYGEHGEHAHDFTWDDTGKLIDRKTRELTEEEIKENSDIL